MDFLLTGTAAYPQCNDFPAVVGSMRGAGFHFTGTLHPARVDGKMETVMKPENPIEEIWRIRDELGAEEAMTYTSFLSAQA